MAERLGSVDAAHAYPREGWVLLEETLPFLVKPGCRSTEEWRACHCGDTTVELRRRGEDLQAVACPGLGVGRRSAG